MVTRLNNARWSTQRRGEKEAPRPSKKGTVFAEITLVGDTKITKATESDAINFGRHP